MGLLLECDGVMVDVHRDAHRVAFNQAFQSMGLDCAHWSPQVYHDVMRGGKGSGEGMIIAYFNTVGWPLMVTEKDRVGYAQELHRMKRAAMKEMVENDQVEFRDGVLEFLDDALSAGAKVGLVAGTASAPDEHVVDMVMRKLGSDRASKISVFEGFSNGEGVEEDEQTKDSEEVLEDVASSLVAAAAEKQRKLKRNIARQASEGGVGVWIRTCSLKARVSAVTGSMLSRSSSWAQNSLAVSSLVPISGLSRLQLALAYSLQLCRVPTT
eukprot:jgi/Pico_ML_1/55872/g1493.t1